MKNQPAQQRKKNGNGRRMAVIIGIMILVAGFFWLLIGERTSSRPSNQLEIAAQKEFQEEMMAAQEEFQQKIEVAAKEAEQKSDSLINLHDRELNP